MAFEQFKKLNFTSHFLVAQKNALFDCRNLLILFIKYFQYLSHSSLTQRQYVLQSTLLYTFVELIVKPSKSFGLKVPARFCARKCFCIKIYFTVIQVTIKVNNWQSQYI